MTKRTCAPGAVCFAFSFDEVDSCPNWYAALHVARLAAGCYGAKEHNRCQEKLRACHACDICPILQPNEGPATSLANSFSEPRRRAQAEGPHYSNLWSDWSVKFLKRGCLGEVDVLAGDMIEEAAHACPSIGGGPIYDEDNWFVPAPPGCSGTKIQNVCMRRISNQ